MYPETDVPPMRIRRKLLVEITRSLPRPLQELIDRELVEDFLSFVRSDVTPSFIASLLTGVIKDLGGRA